MLFARTSPSARSEASEKTHESEAFEELRLLPQIPRCRIDLHLGVGERERPGRGAGIVILLRRPARPVVATPVAKETRANPPGASRTRVLR